ncbi:MAG: CBS domain-containing protein [Nitrososphaerota archaeon]|nr:CBS domain-containing protein [Candidatus Bathyarchaeota archaeon]MDW8022693.1 CBS domain-containing protein [Nitrososphaerota archaeon]
MGIVVTVKSVMTKNIIAVEKGDPVIKAINLMVKNNIGSVVVNDGGKPVGILTERDIMKRVCPQELCTKKVSVGEVMSHPLITIEADSRLGEAALLMLEKNIRRLLVVEKGKVVGIVTQKDIMRGTLETFMALSMIR